MGISKACSLDIYRRTWSQAKELGLKTDKITGANPAALARAIDAYYAKITGEYPKASIIGSMEHMEFSMPAVNWIAHMPETLLYVSNNEVPQESKDALQKRDGKAIMYILGPEEAVSSKVENELKAYGKTVRISGKDHISNSIAFAKYKDKDTGFGWGITDPGHNFSFINLKTAELAVAAAPFSHLGKHAPLLWIDTYKVPDDIMYYLMSVQPKFVTTPTERPYNHSFVTGSEKSITESVRGEIDNMLEIESASGKGYEEMGSMPGMNY